MKTQKELNKLLKNAKPKHTDDNRVVLAYGEVTGHAHAFYGEDSCELLEVENPDVKETQTIIKMNKDDVISHEEHTQHAFKTGDIGIVTIQREYVRGELRRTVD